MRRRRWLSILVMILLAAGGCRHGAEPRAQTASSLEIRIISARQTLTRAVQPRTTVAQALRGALPPSDQQRRTVVLLRRDPEGQSRMLIDIHADGRPVNPAQDVLLRDGDALILPAQPAPQGLNRPPELAVEGAAGR